MGDRARVWIGPRNSDGEIRMVCVHAPVTVNFAWRVAARDDRDRTTTGMLTCDTDVDGRDIKINLSKCTRGPDWNEYK